MNAQATITLRNAFAASGMIRAEHNALERHRRELLLAPLEEAVAAAWSAERWANGARPVDPELSARMSAIRKAAHDRAAEANRAKRQERKRAVAAILAQGPMQRADLEGLVDLSGGALKALLRDMVDDGMITMNRAPGAGRNFVYEVAQ